MGANQGIKYLVKFLWILGALACISITATAYGKLKDSKSPDGDGSLKETKYKEYDPDELKSLHFSCNHMSQLECFNFSIREQEGKITFSAWFYPEEGEKIDLEDILVKPKYMEEIRGIVGDYGLNNVKIKSESKKNKVDSIIVHDMTSYRFVLYWKDGAASEMGYPGSGGEAIEAFLKNLAKIYAKKGFDEESNGKPSSQGGKSSPQTVGEITREDKENHLD